MSEFEYPTENLIEEYNALAITMFEVKKADKSEVMSRAKLTYAINRCKETEGDIYDKAAVLLKELIKAHAFASGNRRTAFIATLDFVKHNKGKFNIKDEPNNAKAFTGIREGYYSHEEIRDWIKNGKIKEFKR